MAGDFKPTQMRELYDALGDLKEEEQTAIAEWHAEDPKLLLHRFRHDLATVASYDIVAESFYERETRRPLPDPPTPVAEIRSTPEFASQLTAHGVQEVEGKPDMAFRYVDREIFPLRQTASGGPRPERRWLDLLLVSESGLPIVGELKIRTDRTTYFALIQALMYAVELSSPTQLERLATHNPDAGFRWPAEGPFLDIYLIVFDPPRPSEQDNRARSMRASQAISEKLTSDSTFSSIVRRVACIEALQADDRLAFRSLFAFGTE